MTRVFCVGSSLLCGPLAAVRLPRAPLFGLSFFTTLDLRRFHVYSVPKSILPPSCSRSHVLSSLCVPFPRIAALTAHNARSQPPTLTCANLFRCPRALSRVSHCTSATSRITNLTLKFRSLAACSAFLDLHLLTAHSP